MNELETIRSRIHEIRGARVMLDFDLAQMYGVETRVLNQAVKRNIERFPEDFMFQLTKGELEILRSQIVTLNDLKFQNGMSNVPVDQQDEDWKSQIVISNPAENQRNENWISQIATSNFAKMGLRNRPYAFTELGVAMLSSVLRSPLAIQVNIGIMRAFVEMRRRVSAVSDAQSDVAQLRKDFEELKQDIEDMLRDQNDINESTRAQLDAISTALVELQGNGTSDKPRRRIGFVQD
jgi:hypothetical protein